MPTSTFRVKALVSDIRKRWRRRALIQGGALTLLAFLFFASVLLLLYTRFDVPPAYLAAGLVVGGVVVLGVLVQYVLRPALRKLSDRQIALYVEERFPELEDRLNSAVEVDDAAALRREHSILLDRLIDDATRQVGAVPVATVVDRQKERILAYGTAAFLGLFLIFGYTSLGDLRGSLAGVELATLRAPEAPLITVSPGNVEIEKGASQEIIAALREDTDREVTLHYKLGEAPWQKEAMKKGVGDPVFLAEFLSIQEPIQYFVEYDQQRTDPFTITLYEFPDVAQIDLTYTYPRYTGRAPEQEEDRGDIRGLKGSTVTLDVHTTGTVETAELVLDDERTISLEAAGEGRFRGRVALEQPGTYFIRLTDAAGKNNKFPEEHQIVPVEDEKPRVTITDPQRDVRANAIEEVLVAVEVEDDYGLKDVRLRYVVNGEEEQTIRLADVGEARPTEVAGDHLFFLEDFGLEPGDVISYYVEAEDYFHEAAPEASDMYFIEVIPFDQRFSQANNAGMNMGGGQPSGIVLNQQQIIAATWKLLREREEMEAGEFEESRRALVQAQANLRSEIEQRINTTAFSLELRGSEESRKVVELLRGAVVEMGGAMEELEAARLQEALGPERRALNQLLKADALNKERQVALNRQQGGGSMSATEERMTELMDLELDISKDKYEVQQQRAQAQQEQEVDEALQRIRELARKQQNLANQSQRQLEGEDKKRFVDRLKRDQDELRQQTESLADAMRQRSRDNQQLSRDMEERLERVAENMREAERALRDGDTQQARARQQQAMNELDRLQRELEMTSTQNLREQLGGLARDFDQFKEQEEQLGRDIEKEMDEARARGGQPDEERLDRLQEKRQNMIDNLQRLQNQAEALEGRTRQEDPDLSSSMRNLRRRMDREGLEEKMRDSEQALDQGWLDYAGRLQEEIQTSIERLDTEMRALDDRLPVTEEEQLARALDDVRDLLERMDEMQGPAPEQGQPSSSQPQQGDSQEATAPSPESQQGQASPQQGQATPQQGQAGGAPADGDRAERAAAARQQRRLEQAREALERLQERFEGNPQAQRTLEGVQEFLGRADHTGVLLEGEAAKRFFEQRVYDPLSQLEMELTRQLDAIALERKLYGARKGDVPPQYRDMVEKYYESLAKSRER